MPGRTQLFSYLQPGLHPFSVLLQAHESLFHHIVQSYVNPCNSFEFSHISSPPAKSTVCKGSVFPQICDKIQSSIHQIFTRCIQHSSVSIELSHMEEHSPSCSILLCFTIEPLRFVAFPFFYCSPPNPLQRIYEISIDSGKPPHSLVFHSKQNFLFGDFLLHSPLPPERAGTSPKGTCSFSRPWYPSFKRIRA